MSSGIHSRFSAPMIPAPRGWVCCRPTGLWGSVDDWRPMPKKPRRRPVGWPLSRPSVALPGRARTSGSVTAPPSAHSHVSCYSAGPNKLLHVVGRGRQVRALRMRCTSQTSRASAPHTSPAPGERDRVFMSKPRHGLRISRFGIEIRDRNAYRVRNGIF